MRSKTDYRNTIAHEFGNVLDVDDGYENHIQSKGIFIYEMCDTD